MALIVSSQQNNRSQNPSFLQQLWLSFKNFVITYLGDPSQYVWETLIICIFIISGINFVLGRRLNNKYAFSWMEANKPVFESEFSQIGVSTETGEILEIEGANSFKFFASGRKNCVYAMVTMELKRRHDLFSMAIVNLIWPQKDRLRLEIPIDTVNNLPFLFAVAKRKEAKFVHDNYPDINYFCNKMTHDELDREYVVLGEDEEVSEYILTSSVIVALKKYDNIIEMISFTDLRKPHKQVLRVDMQIPNNLLKNPKEFQNIIKTTLSLVDHIAIYKMSNVLRNKAEKARQLYDLTKDKEERKEKRENAQKDTQKNKKEGTQKKEEKKNA